ncbi:hypothetical protein GCM10010345_19910 [Streptomyces canarius]|uniref:Transposase n=1 Tax=Streptomyces canarius TaxID=285453 RepID=A0ABQ3CJN1_9ACTN|nr:hypothetical protein GCM10010345_19910 [Streptomyces canarius]
MVEVGEAGAYGLTNLDHVLRPLRLKRQRWSSRSSVHGGDGQAPIPDGSFHRMRSHDGRPFLRLTT